MTVTSENAQVELRNIGAHYSLANGNAEIQGIHAQLLGGTLLGAVTMRDLAGSTRSHLSASLRAVSLAELQSKLQRTMSSPSSSAANQIALRGLLNATADAAWVRPCRTCSRALTPRFKGVLSRRRAAQQLLSTGSSTPDTSENAGSWRSSKATSEPPELPSRSTVR